MSKDEFPKTVTLPYSGTVATIERRLNGRDSRMAQRAAGRSPDNSIFVFALLAQVVRLDGRETVLEDYLALDLEDLFALYRAVGITPEVDGPLTDEEKKFLTRRASLPLSNGGSPPENSTK